jgi:hypothetical protein
MQEVEGSIPSSSTNFFAAEQKSWWMPKRTSWHDKGHSEFRRHHLLLKTMPTKPGILFFGLTEIFIGSVTLASILDAYITRGATKPLNVLFFVILSSLISIALGIGILKKFRLARKLLVFFAGWVILSKILILGNILSLCCALETTFPAFEKNMCSIIYHLALIITLRRPAIKKELTR